jgi:hypothetical protein
MDEISYISDSGVQRDQCAFNHRMELKEIASKNSQGIHASDPRTSEEIEPLLTPLIEVDPEDPALNPASPSFDVYKWAKVTLSALDKANVKLRRVSYLFKNLTVSGSDPAIDFQATVGSIFMLPNRIQRYITGRKSKDPKSPRSLILQYLCGLECFTG